MVLQSKIFILSQSDMAPTLAKYVDMDNVPKKYGGNLEWQFGDMPNLEPAIVNSLRWKEVIEQKGHKTLPIGPIRWEYDEDGDLVATAIGTQNSKPRSQVIAGLHVESGVARLALSPGRSENQKFFRTTSAQIPTSTEKTTPETNDTAVLMANNSSDADLNVGKDPRSAVQDSSRAGTYTVPFQDESGSRQGTSTTRYEQQAGTHAQGQGADATPNVKVDSQGEKQAVMEPNTVGQAPKEYPPPDTEEQPSVIDQAKDMAGQAVEQAKQLPTTVMSAVGMGQKDETKEPEEKKEDPAVDNMDSKNVEEFLRSQTKSKPDGEPAAQ